MLVLDQTIVVYYKVSKSPSCAYAGNVFVIDRHTTLMDTISQPLIQSAIEV